MSTPSTDVTRPRASRARKVLARLLRTLATWLEATPRPGEIEWQYPHIGDWVR
jgi:hypothetical protein